MLKFLVQDELSGTKTAFFVERMPASIGRSEQGSVTVGLESVTDEYARIEEREDGNYWLVDCSSYEEIRVNGEVTRETKILKGDVIALGGQLIRLMEVGLESRQNAIPGIRGTGSVRMVAQELEDEPKDQSTLQNAVNLIPGIQQRQEQGEGLHSDGSGGAETLEPVRVRKTVEAEGIQPLVGDRDAGAEGAKRQAPETLDSPVTGAKQTGASQFRLRDLVAGQPASPLEESTEHRPELESAAPEPLKEGSVAESFKKQRIHPEAQTVRNFPGGMDEGSVQTRAASRNDFTRAGSDRELTAGELRWKSLKRELLGQAEIESSLEEQVILQDEQQVELVQGKDAGGRGALDSRNQLDLVGRELAERTGERQEEEKVLAALKKELAAVIDESDKLTREREALQKEGKDLIAFVKKARSEMSSLRKELASTRELAAELNAASQENRFG